MAGGDSRYPTDVGEAPADGRKVREVEVREVVDHVLAELAPASAVVKAGDRSVVALRLHNTGQTLEELAIVVQGRLAPNAEVSPARLRLLPGERGEVRLSFRVPTDMMSADESLPYAVAVNSWVTGGLAALAFGQLTVAPA